MVSLHSIHEKPGINSLWQPDDMARTFLSFPWCSFFVLQRVNNCLYSRERKHGILPPVRALASGREHTLSIVLPVLNSTWSKDWNLCNFPAGIDHLYACDVYITSHIISVFGFVRWLFLYTVEQSEGLGSSNSVVFKSINIGNVAGSKLYGHKKKTFFLFIPQTLS